MDFHKQLESMSLDQLIEIEARLNQMVEEQRAERKILMLKREGRIKRVSSSILCRKPMTPPMPIKKMVSRAPKAFGVKM